MKKLIFIALGVSILVCGCKSAETVDTDEIRIYCCDGIFDEKTEPSAVITDKESIDELLKLTGDISDYEEDDKIYEGMNSVWIDFGNGTILGMYDDIDYGNICEYIGEPYGTPCLKIPTGLREKALELTEDCT